MSVGFLMMSALLTVWDNKVYDGAFSESTAESPVPVVPLAVIVVPNKSLETSIRPSRTITPSFGVSTSHPVAFFTSVTDPSFNGIVTLSCSAVGVTFKLPFCHCEIVGAVGCTLKVTSLSILSGA